MHTGKKTNMDCSARPPQTLSSLIRLAIDDARKLNRNVYAPLYSAWHAPDDTQSPQVCNICLAGAVIAGTLQAPPHAYVAWLEKAEIDDREWANALIAVNYARMGRWKLARIKLGRWPTTRQEVASQFHSGDSGARPAD